NHREALLRRPLRHRIMDLNLDARGEDGPAKLRGEILRQAAAGHRAGSGLVQLGDDDLGEGIRRPEVGRQLSERHPGLVFDQPDHLNVGASYARTELHPMADRPESEEPDAVLPGYDQPAPLLGAQAAFSRAADVGRDVPERLLATETGKDALPVVANR